MEIRVEDVTVEYPGVRALDGVSLAFRAGEVHAVIGENGAGKSTLMNVLNGLRRPTSGRVVGDADATAMIHQELNLVGELTVAENLTLGREPGRFVVDRRRQEAEARHWLSAIGSDLDPRRRVGSLGVAGQQAVEIAKAVSRRARFLILDEPTAVLGGREADALLALVRRLRDEGRGIVYVSHRLREVRRVADRVSVLRDGRHVATIEDPSAAGEGALAAMMVGRESMGEQFPPRPAVGEEVAFACGGPFEMAVRRGEVFGLAGLIGAGRTEWAESVVGLRPPRRRVTVAGESLAFRDVREAASAGVAYVSEDRKAAGLHLEMSVAANSTLATLRRYCHPPAMGPLALIDRKGVESVALAHARNLHTKLADVRHAVGTLSGGNQQKVALAKWLDATPRVLILDEPTRGVDVGAKREIYNAVAGLAAGGMACVVISSELPELLGLCHRVGVVRGGRLVGTLDAAGATEQDVMRLAAGADTLT